MTEEITSALAKVKGLNVVARTSAFEFKGENKDLRAIGQALSATHLIEGSVRKDGNQVRITAQLIKADDGTHLWTESYDRELKDIFAIQEDIAQAIAGALQVPLGLKQGETLVPNRTIDTDSYQNYLHAKALSNARRSIGDAIALLQQVVARNPGYAPAWALLADTYSTDLLDAPAVRSGSAEAQRIAAELTAKQEAAAQRAIALDPNQADVAASLGQLQVRRNNLVMAEELYSKALTLDPTNAYALQLKANLLAGVGRPKEGLAAMKAALAIEPFVPGYNSSAARHFWLNGQVATAISILKDLPSDYCQPRSISRRNLRFPGPLPRRGERSRGDTSRIVPAGNGGGCDPAPAHRAEARRVAANAPATGISRLRLPLRWRPRAPP